MYRHREGGRVKSREVEAIEREGGGYSETAQVRIKDKCTEMKLSHLLTVAAQRFCKCSFHEKLTLVYNSHIYSYTEREDATVLWIILCFRD